MRRPRPLRGFVELRPAELEPRAMGGGLFLGRLDHETLRRELSEAGVFAALAARGYLDVALRTASEGAVHSLHIAPGGGIDLVDLRLSEVSSFSEDPLLRRFGLDILSFLSIDWVELQDPRAGFSPERPRLPGQRRPGLGLGRRLYGILLRWAAAWGKDGLLNFPEYLHNAVFYSESFRFLSPERQGRFEALWRALAPLGVAEASAALVAGRVVQDGRVAAWEPAEMVSAVTDRLRLYVASPEYRAGADAAQAAARFEVRG